MIDVIAVLETDHRVVEQLLDVLADSEPGPEREQAVQQLAASLQLHMQFEEAEIYPLLRQQDQEMAEEAETEHTLTREGLTKLQELVDAPGFGAVVDMLKGGIGHHVKDEEEEAFPQLRQSSDTETLQRLGEQLVSEKRSRGALERELGYLTKSQLDEMARMLDVSGRSSMSTEELRHAVAAS